ncbi:46145_t:CDS:1, partial [Gigaspora margarita]
KRTKKQFHIRQPNLNAGTVVNEINGRTFGCINSEAKIMSKKRDHEVWMRNLCNL